MKDLRILAQTHMPIRSTLVYWAASAHDWHWPCMLASPPAACSILCANYALVGSRKSGYLRNPDTDLLDIDPDPFDYWCMIAGFE